MFTTPFDYRNAHSVQDVIEWLQEDPDNTKILAGGHSLLPLMKLRLSTVSHLIDIGQIPELQGIVLSDNELRVGAFTRYVQLVRDPSVALAAPLVAEAARVIGDLQVRNRGTIGGSLCHADPAADLPAALLALGAELEIAGPAGKRREDIDSFFLAPFITTLAPGEVLTAIHIPRMAQGARSIYLKRPHLASGYPIIGVAAWVVLRDEQVDSCRIAITGIGSVPFRAFSAEQMLVGQTFTRDVILQAAEQVASDQSFDDDDDGYKANLCRVYVTRALAALGNQG
ncbi:MAG: carbon monoxide dehydrogenase [Sulfobacillus thermosulfidooxidans]|nr:MAG: carbon monoxide dehydrogenase [Sulfobacillus thermosulfidooxidans]